MAYDYVDDFKIIKGMWVGVEEIEREVIGGGVRIEG